MAPEPPKGKEEKVRALDEDDIALLKSYGQGPYSARIKDIEKDVKDTVKKVNDVSGIKESDTGLAAPSRWDLVSDKQAMQEEQPLQVSCTSQITYVYSMHTSLLAFATTCNIGMSLQHTGDVAGSGWLFSADSWACSDSFAG